MSEKPEFPQVWDSTMRAALVKCETYLNYAYFKSLRKPESGIHLHFGAAFAKGLEATRKSYWERSFPTTIARTDGAEAIMRAWGDPALQEQHDRKNLANCLLAHDAYFNEYPLDSDHVTPHKIGKKYAIEMNFGLPIPGTRHPITGEPLIYAGRFDLLGDMNEATFVVDEKTATSLGASWRNQWRLRSQFTGYCWGASQYGIPVQGAIIRGIGILKEKITFEQAIVTRPQWMIERWLDELRNDLNHAISAWERNRYRLNLDNSCTEYGGCAFLDLCESKEPERWESNYEVKPWNPLKVSDAA